jgi:hypothetical protein
MAQGFESKSVQSQQQDAEAVKHQVRGKNEDRATMERRKKREGFELSRRRIVRELGETRSDRRREQLRAALEHLDRELAKLQ